MPDGSFCLEAVVLSFAERRDPLLHPARHRLSFEIVVEELLQTLRDILAVLARLDVVQLTVVLQHPYRLLQTTQSHEHLDTLIPGHCLVGIVVHDQKRCLHSVGMEYG